MSKAIINRCVIIAMVLLSYAIFSLPHLHLQEFSKKPQTHYQYLTAGFLAGHLNLSIDPSPDLLNLYDPYDPNVNSYYRLHDASLYNNKYYLYFGPLPVVSFFIPFKLLTNLYAPPVVAIWFFCSMGFILNFLLLIQIKEKYFPTLSNRQVNLFWFLMSLTLIPIIMILFLCSVAGTAQRYESDFLPYLVLSGIVVIWYLQAYTMKLAKFASRYFMVLSSVSILLGISRGLFGFKYKWNYVFFSVLTNFLFFLMPLALIFIYFLIRTIPPLITQKKLLNL